MTQEQVLFVCEGYHDRAFLAGWLEHLGYPDPAEAMKGKIQVYDPWQQRVVGKQFGYAKERLPFIRVVPAGGKTELTKTAEPFVKEHGRKPIRHLVFFVDADVAAAHDRKVLVATDFPHLIDAGKGVPTDVIIWQTADQAPLVGVPTKQTLERLVCSALAAAYPARAAAVAEWLRSRPEAPPEHDHKAHAWSYMAGWAAGDGCEAFLKKLWTDGKVASELRVRLRDTDAWDIIAQLTS